MLSSYHLKLDEANRRLIEMERMRADNAVHDYRLLAENITDVIFTADLSLRLTYVSPSIQRLRGYSREESLGQGLQEWFTEDSLRAVKEISQEVIKIANLNHGGRFMSRTLELEVTPQERAPDLDRSQGQSPAEFAGTYDWYPLCSARHYGS